MASRKFWRKVGAAAFTVGSLALAHWVPLAGYPLAFVGLLTLAIIQ